MNFKENYRLQDKILSELSDKIPKFYLTGGTALSRFYLNHRYSEDLDFFADNILDFPAEVLKFRRLLSMAFQVSEDRLIQYESYSRMWVSDGAELKVEIVNDTGSRWGDTIQNNGILIDSISNILANKLTAVVSRDEPKDVFDIVAISESYSFNWDEVFTHSVEKAFISEPDIPLRLREFPISSFESIYWLKTPVDSSGFLKKLETIIHDFTLARDNSLGVDQPAIIEAKLNVNGLQGID